MVVFGTSTPELFVNIVASLKGNTDIAFGNVLGSDIANILLILGVSSLIYPLSVSKGTVWKEIPFSLIAALILAIMVNDQFVNHEASSVLNRANGLILLCVLSIFIYYICIYPDLVGDRNRNRDRRPIGKFDPDSGLHENRVVLWVFAIIRSCMSWLGFEPPAFRQSLAVQLQVAGEGVVGQFVGNGFHDIREHGDDHPAIAGVAAPGEGVGEASGVGVCECSVVAAT